MKNQIKKHITLTCTALSVLALPQFAMSTETNSEKEEVMVITANRFEQNINDTLAAVEVITREDIERIQPESITDLLTTIAGFDFAHNGGAGQRSSTFTRGSNSGHTLVLVDGVRVASATSGDKSYSTIPVAQIERIEIVKGPRAALWGSDAIGGVVHIFTRRLNAGELSTELTAGSDSYLDANLVLGFGNEKLKNTLTLSHTNSDGFDVVDNGEDDNDGYRRVSLSFRGDYQLSDALTLDWVAQLDSGNSEYDNSWGADETDYDNYLWNIRYSYNSDNWLTQFSLSQSHDDQLNYTYDPVKNVPKAVGSVFATTRNQANLVSQYKVTDSFGLSGGLEYFRNDVSDSKNVVSFLPDETYSELKQENHSAFFASNLVTDSIVGELSLRRDEIELVDDENTFNLSLGYKLLDNLTLAVARAKGFRAPTFNELFHPDAGYYKGNPDLVAEKSLNNELLLKGHWHNHSLTISHYENKVSNLINYDGALAQSVNINRANLKGQELIYQNRGEVLSHKASVSFVSAKDLSLDAETGLAKNTQLQRRARKHINYELTADFEAISLFTQLSYVGKRPDVDYSTWPSTNVELDSYIQVNFGSSFQVGANWLFKLKVNDVFDEAPESVLTYNSAGRQIFLTAQFRNF